MSEKHILTVNSIVCAACIGPIANQLQNSAIHNFSIDLITKTIYIEHDESLTVEDIIQRIEKAGHEAKLLTDETNPKNRIIFHLIMGIVATLTGSILMFIHSMPVLPVVFFPALCAGIAIPGIFGSGYWIFKNAYDELFKRRALNMDVLFSMSLSIIVISSILNLFVPVLGLPMLCHTGLMIAGFRNLGQFLNEQAKTLAGKNDFILLPYSKKYELEDGSQILKEEIKPGQKIKLKSDQYIPCDGIITEGTILVDEKRMTGEILPIQKGVGEELFAGSQIRQDSCLVKATSSFSDSQYEKAQSQIRQFNQNESSLDTLSKKIIRVFLPSLLGIAISSSIVISFFNPLQALMTFVGILVGACPCILGLINPLANKLAYTQARNLNTSIKDAQSLETLSSADTFIFDKTGTLTELKVNQTTPLSKQYSKEDIENIALVLERESTHPIAEAIKTSFQTNQTIHMESVQSELLGRKGIHQQETFYIGDRRYLESNNISIPNSQEDISQQNFPTIHIANSTHCIGKINFKESIKSGVPELMTFLKQQGKQISILTGGGQESAQHIAMQLGLENNFKAQQLPIDKAQYITDLKKAKHVVAMMGDGNNDAFALCTSNINISFDDADEAAQKKSSLILPQKTAFSSLEKLILLSQKNVKNIKQSIWLCLGIGLSTVLANLTSVAVLGSAINPALMAALMLFQITAVITNLYRPYVKSYFSNYFMQKNKILPPERLNIVQAQSSPSSCCMSQPKEENPHQPSPPPKVMC